MEKDEHAEYKAWLRELLPEGMSQQSVADELGVTRKTISNLLSPNQGFGSGLVMLRYLQLAGAVSYAPERGDSLLQRLVAMAAESAEQTARSLEAIQRQLDALAARLPGEDAQGRTAAR